MVSSSVSGLFAFKALEEVDDDFADFGEVYFEDSGTCVAGKTSFEDLTKLSGYIRQITIFSYKGRRRYLISMPTCSNEVRAILNSFPSRT